MRRSASGEPETMIDVQSNGKILAVVNEPGIYLDHCAVREISKDSDRLRLFR